MEADVQPSQIHITLLKTRSAPTDAYDTTLAAPHPSYTLLPRFIPVLEHVHQSPSLDTLAREITSHAFNPSHPVSRPAPGDAPYAALVFTSQRAVEAFESTLATIEDAAGHFSPALPIYVVGPATARAVKALGLPCRVAGEESGNGHALAQFILDDLGADAAGKRVLFPTGETRRDVIPATLGRAGVRVDEVVVYATREAETFAARFGEACAVEGVHWVVVFSPQGCRAMLGKVGYLDDMGERVKRGCVTPEERKGSVGRVYVASIGPTTRDFLKEEFGFEVDVCCARPDAEAVREGVLGFMEASGIR